MGQLTHRLVNLLFWPSECARMEKLIHVSCCVGAALHAEMARRRAESTGAWSHAACIQRLLSCLGAVWLMVRNSASLW